MLEKNSIKYYLFSLANFISAFGGGTILGKCLGIIQNVHFHGDSVLAFFLGIVLGLIFLQFLPQKKTNTAIRWFSFCGAFSSLFLYFLFQKLNIQGQIIGLAAILFFFVLTVRFTFWFYSRVLRASEAAGYQGKIAWVELGYYSGIILGLIVWNFFQIRFSIESILLFDALLQVIAGCLDNFSIKKTYLNLEPRLEATLNKFEDNHLANKDCWKLAIALMVITITVQGITFNLGHLSSEKMNSYIIAIFYFGVAIAAIMYRKLTINFDWEISGAKFGYAVINFNKMKVKFFIINVFLTILIFAEILIYFLFVLSSKKYVFISIFCTAFFYEIMALAILDKIGFEVKKMQANGSMIIKSYGLMGIGVAICLWGLNVIHSNPIYLIMLMFSSFVLSSMILINRSRF